MVVFDLTAWRKPESAAGSSAPAIMIGAFVAFGGILFGYDTGTISGIIAMRWWLDNFSTGSRDDDGLPSITPTQSSEIVSILSAGTFFGALLAAPVGDRIGRRKSLMLAVVVFTFGVAMQTASTTIRLFAAGRFFAGMGVGTISVLVPLYQSEMAPKWIRGALVCCYQLAITVGLFIASVVNYLTSNIDSANCFRIPVAIQFVWAGILFIGLIILPETPRYLIKREMHAAAAASLSRIRRLDITHPALIEEIAEIEANHAYELSLGPSTYRDVFRGAPHLGFRVLTGSGLQMLQQLSGCNFVFYYGTTFFKHAGIESPFTYSLVTNVVNVACTLPGMFLVESWGRRRLLLVGAVGMATSQIIVAIVGTAFGAQPDDQMWNKVMIAFVCLYIAFFAMSWGPVVWVVTSEIYPLKVRAKSMSISTATNWLFNWAIAYATPYLVNDGPGYADLGAKVFFVWGTFCVAAFFFVWFLVFETSKISLEQIDELYERVDHAWHSASFQPSWSFQDIQENEVGQASGVSLADRTEARRRQAEDSVAAAAVGHGHGYGYGHDSESGHGITPTPTGSSQATSSATETEEDKIIASLGTVNFTF
ncbi:hypothetical protein V502_06080 [Pseudogymnoascus sp. VKM F-4520 (FW-2644)]|nr:hypothetical protein V502_06080 [Pseudogymnoascus sp. VKM F-4520 (FW-2644)]